MSTRYFWSENDNKEMTVEQIRDTNPNASIPENADLSFMGYFDIIEEEKPVINRNKEGVHYSIEQTSIKGIKKYVRRWSVYTLSDRDIKNNEQLENERIQQMFVHKAQEMLDNKAVEYGYDNIISACSYINSTNPEFKREAESFVKYRDEVWVFLLQLLDDVKRGVREKPASFDEIVSGFPVLSLEA